MVPILKIGVSNTHEFKSHLILLFNDYKKMQNLRTEILYRVGIISITSIILLIVIAGNINEAILIILNPIKELHND